MLALHTKVLPIQTKVTTNPNPNLTFLTTKSPINEFQGSTHGITAKQQQIILGLE